MNSTILSIIRTQRNNGFSLERNEKIKIENKRLGIEYSLTDDSGRYIEIYNEKTYWHILHYGFDKKYLPIGYDILFAKDLENYNNFLKQYL